MKLREVIQKAKSLAEPFRVSDGSSFRLKHVDPGNTLHLKSDDKLLAKDALAIGVEALTVLQDMLYAQDRWAVLLIFQAMDAASCQLQTKTSRQVDIEFYRGPELICSGGRLASYLAAEQPEQREQ